MAGLEHVVQQGDCMASIGMHSGFFWETIWEHAENQQLKTQRRNPNVLFEGDVVRIPEKRLREEARATEARHRFRRKGVPETLQIILKDEFDQPRADLPYVLIIDGKSTKGRTDSQGKLRASIPPDANEGRLVVGEGDDR